MLHSTSVMLIVWTAGILGREAPMRLNAAPYAFLSFANQSMLQSIGVRGSYRPRQSPRTQWRSILFMISMSWLFRFLFS